MKEKRKNKHLFALMKDDGGGEEKEGKNDKETM